MAEPTSRRGRRLARHRIEASPWDGPNRHYDIIAELGVAFVVVTLLTLALALTFGSPDDQPVTLEGWANATPRQFLSTSLSELEGSSVSAQYGPPYNHGTGSVQQLGGVSPQRLFGVHYPLNPARDFVIDPLRLVPGEPSLRAALASYSSASAAQRASWQKAYDSALQKGASLATLQQGGRSYGPVGPMLGNLLGLARSGALDAALVSHGTFYTQNYTRPIMFLGDSTDANNSYWASVVSNAHLLGNQWGMMNETGAWPGQPWLWLYTLWYQVPPMNSSSNGDLMVVSIMAVLSVGLLLVPFIPLLRSVPRWVPLHRLIWREWYRTEASRAGATHVGSGRSL